MHSLWQKLISSSVSIHAPATFAVCIQHLQCSFTLPSLEFCVRSVLACHCLPTQPSTYSLCWECCCSNTFLSFREGSWMLPFLSSVKLFDEIGIKDLLHNPHKCWNLNYFLGQSSTTLGSSSSVGKCQQLDPSLETWVLFQVDKYLLPFFETVTLIACI